jgi:hypothetical protein
MFLGKDLAEFGPGGGMMGQRQVQTKAQRILAFILK